MINSDKKSNVFFSVFFIFLVTSILVTYYRYIIRQDFQYFTTENKIPNQFDIHSYTNQL